VVKRKLKYLFNFLKYFFLVIFFLLLKSYLFNVAYGVGKAACDRMAIDCGIELKKHKVACLSLMLG
jgi:hypothetical protein